MHNINKKKLIIYTIFLLVAIMVVTFISNVSILYWGHKQPFNSDLNTYLDIGNAINNNKVLYRDIVDTKGPLFLYFISLLLRLPINIFHLIYVIEIGLAFIYCILQYKIISLHSQNVMLCVLSSCLSVMLYHIMLVSHLSGTFEEYSIVIITYIFYLVEKSITNKQPLTNKQLIVIGILCSIIFLSKFSILLFVFPIGIYYLYYNRKNILKTILIFLLGFSILLSIVFCYLAYKMAITDYFYYQFIANMNRINGFPRLNLTQFLWFFGIPLLICILTVKHTYKYILLIIPSLIITLLLLHMPFGHSCYTYYLVSAYYTCSIFVYYILTMFEKYYVIIIICINFFPVVGDIIACNNSNISILDGLLNTIDSLETNIDNTTIYSPTVNLGIDYYYNIVPNRKYYNNGKTFQEQYDEMELLIKSQKYKYIIKANDKNISIDFYNYYEYYKPIDDSKFSFYIRKTN